MDKKNAAYMELLDILEYSKGKRKFPRNFYIKLRIYSFSLIKRFDFCFSILTLIIYSITIIGAVSYKDTFMGSYSYIILTVVLFPLMLYWLLIILAYTRRITIFFSGKLYDANIVGIKQVYFNISGTSIYRLTFNCKIKNRVKICYSYVRAESISHFYDIMNSDDNNIKILYNGKKIVGIPLDIICMNEFIENFLW